MQVRDIMSANPACCSADASLQEVAKMMVDHDCGEIPVVDDQNRPVGVVTDRDICCRAVAQGMDPAQTKAKDVMSSPALTIGADDTVEDCCKLMDNKQIRRVPVVDDTGACCGIVAQADLARKLDEPEVGHVLRDISQPSQEARVQH